MQNQSGKAQGDLMKKHAEDKHALEIAHIKEVSAMKATHHIEREQINKQQTEAMQQVQAMKAEHFNIEKDMYTLN